MPRHASAPRSPAMRGLAVWLLGALVVAPPGLPAAVAAPEGENVVSGEASFARDGDLTVIRPSDGAIIEYTGFDILRHEAVRFEQPSERARVLNKVSGEATRIDGSLSANGIVYIVNPAGVFFGGDAVVEVGRLVAAAGELPDHEFLRGVDAFSLSGALENRGSIEAASVSLLGRSVANHGTIVAPDGVIALVAGERVVLTQLEGGIAVEVEGPAGGAEVGVEQTGRVDAGAGALRFAVGDHYSLAINHTGVTRGRDVEFAGGADGLVRVAGTLDASAPEPGETGGSLRVTGDRVALEGAWLDASGAAGGGEILVGGDRRGEGPLANARRTFVDTDSTLRADALESGDGGSVVVYGDEAAGFLGRISARGGAAGGDGGFAELSSAGLLIDEGQVDVGAPAGEAGSLLYDPRDIVIRGGTAQDGSDDPDLSADLLNDGTEGRVLFGDASDPEPFLVFESELEGTNANIELQARNSITVANDTFDHDANGAEAGYEGDGVVAMRPDNDFILRTRNNAGDSTGSTTAAGIDLRGSVHGDALEFRVSGDGGIQMHTGNDGAGGGGSGGMAAALAVGALTSTGGPNGFIFLSTRDGSITANRITSSGALGMGSENGRNAGRITLSMGDDDGSGGNAVLVTGDLTAVGGGSDAGHGGNGSVVQIETRGKTLPAPPAGQLPPPPQGGGPITVQGAIDTRGGNGPAGGGDGGLVRLQSNGLGDVSATTITSRGGDANDAAAASNGGSGALVDLFARSGDISVGAIDNRGGNTDGHQFEIVDGETVPLEVGGSGGLVSISGGIRPEEVANLLLNGNIDTRGGDGPENGEGAGGEVSLNLQGSIEHAGQAGPHIATQGDIFLVADDAGAVAPLEISGGGTEAGILSIEATGTARLLAGAGGFDVLQVRAASAAADIEVSQGADRVDLKPAGPNTSEVVQLDTRESGAIARVALLDDVEDDPLTTGVDEDLHLTLRVRTNSSTPGSDLLLQSEDDIVLGDSDGVVITMQPLPEDPDDPDAPSVSGPLTLLADEDGDGKGAILDLPGAGSGRIDLVGLAEESGGLTAIASAGVGTATDPIAITGGGKIAMQTQESGGVFVRNVGSGDLIVAEEIGGVHVREGNGAIELDNTVGDLVILDRVSTSGDTDGAGGAVTLRAASGSQVVLGVVPNFFDPNGIAVDANGELTFAGATSLIEDSRVLSQEGDVVFQGAVDTDTARGDEVRSLRVTTRAALTQDGVIRLASDVGAQSDLRDLTFLGDVVLAGGARQIHTTGTTIFAGDIRGTTQDGESLTLNLGPRVEIRGDVGAGAGERLASFTLQRNAAPPFGGTLADPIVNLRGNGTQQIVTGAGGITFGGRTTVPDRATLAKFDGDLRLESVGGNIDLGQNQKLTVQGRADLVATTGTVHVGDVSALELHVDSNAAVIRAREPGQVLLQGGGRSTDGGTDLFGNVVNFSTAPTVEGTGPAPRIAAQTATNIGGLGVVGFDGSLAAGDLVRGLTALDLAILPVDPGHETPQPPPPIVGLVPPRPGDDNAGGSALAPGMEETLAFLRCSAERRSDCAVVPASPLDSPRGAELAQDAALFLGDSPEARERRAGLARLEPSALRELAVFLTEIRLLGLSDTEYQAVRDSIYQQILADGPGAPDAQAFAAAVEGQARGVPL